MKPINQEMINRYQSASKDIVDLLTKNKGYLSSADFQGVRQKHSVSSSLVTCLCQIGIIKRTEHATYAVKITDVQPIHARKVIEAVRLRSKEQARNKTEDKKTVPKSLTIENQKNSRHKMQPGKQIQPRKHVSILWGLIKWTR